MQAEHGEGTFSAPLPLREERMAISSASDIAVGSWIGERSCEDESTLFERLISRHQERLYRVAFRMTGNHEEAQDLLQDAIVEAFKAFPHFRRGTYFDKWLYRIMSHTFIDHYRRQRRVRFESLDDPSGAAFGVGEGSREIADPVSDPAYRLEQETLAEPIQAALDRLPADFRLVLILADIEEFSYEEISEMLHCPIGTVRSRLHRARAHVKKGLEKAGYIAWRPVA
jgi:RNA polymerase sigma-70 factor (ECF subfamily)